VQVGGPDVLSFAEMLDRMAVALGKRPRPKLRVPLLAGAVRRDLAPGAGGRGCDVSCALVLVTPSTSA
jgi:hypothetical protein